MEVNLELRAVVPSLNKLLRLHWSVRRKLQTDWQWMIHAQCLSQGLIGRNFPRALPDVKLSVTITRAYKRDALDLDNLHGAAKVILDAMKGLELIWDDSPAHIALICDQVKGPPRTSIAIRPCAD